MSKKKIQHLSSKQGYDLYAKFYDKKNKYLDSFEQYNIFPNLPNLMGKKVLDVGAGSGRLTTQMVNKGAEVTAFDVSPEILKVLAKKNSKIKTVIGDAEKMPFLENSFDVVVATFLIVHLKDLNQFFAEAHRVLKPSGIFLLTNINQKKAPELKTDKGLIIIESYYHRPEEVVEKLEENLFEVNKNIFIKEKDVWINQVVVGSK